VIKDGEVVVREGEVVKTVYGKTYYVNPDIPNDLRKELDRFLKTKFKQYYSITLESFHIGKHELRRAVEIPVSTKLGGM
jgi:formylmethanofuran dehydrogenase subunit A